MELKKYLLTLFRWWWLIAVALITVMIATIIFTYTTTPLYETSVRFIVRPSAVTITDLKELRSSLTALDKPNVANTYAEIAQSRSIKQLTWEQLGIKPLSDFEIRASVLQQTNIIVITVSGPDPETVFRLAETNAELTLNFIDELYEVYDLTTLDFAVKPTKPSSPNKKLNLALGVILGLGVGVLCAFLAEYLQTPLTQLDQTSILDPITGSYKTSYFLRRLREEMSRSQRVKRPFIVSMLRLDDYEEIVGNLSPDAQGLVIKQAVDLIKQSLPEENLVTLWKENILTLLMPDSELEIAQKTLRQLQTKLAWTPFEVGDTGVKLNLTVTVHTTVYDLKEIVPETVLDQAESSLQNGANQKTSAQTEENVNETVLLST